MCRYATPYKPTLVCFGCRKAFKRMLPHDIGHTGPEVPATCPQCAGPMADLGRDFAPPKQRDVKRWQVLEGLWEIGETYHSCGCGGPGYRPRTPQALAAYVARLRVEYLANLQAAVHAEPTPTPARRFQHEQGPEAYWRERLARIDRYLAPPT